jgi:TRAP-type mannitol/chloroaromatic compound transport system permease small subunit
MNALLACSRFVDTLNERVGRAVTWMVLAAVLVSAVNATVRKVFNYSSNAYLEAQWYMFSAIFLLCAAWTLLRNEHIRIDVVAGRFSKRTQTLIDVFGTLFFLLPMVGLVLWQSIPWAIRALNSGEVSPSAGGLVLWPAKILVPIGFTLLGLQGLSELVKRIAFLSGKGPDPTERFVDKSAEEQLAEELRKEREALEERAAAAGAGERKPS